MKPILHLFRSGILHCVTRLDGMFAFVLATHERIIAARDPLGIKPLYVARLGDGLAFASELKAFDGMGIESVEAIPPGGLLDSLDGPRRWYRTSHGAAEAEEGIDEEAIWRELRLVLEEAVRKWMVADVEVGSFLSGGLDSSIIAALAIQASPRRLKTSQFRPRSATPRPAPRRSGSFVELRFLPPDEVVRQQILACLAQYPFLSRRSGAVRRGRVGAPELQRSGDRLRTFAAAAIC